MRYTVVLDRIEGEVAILLIGEEQVAVQFPVAFLPTSQEGALIEFLLTEQPQQEQKRRAEVEGLLAKLLSKRQSVDK